jgi:hypothetical protein
MSWVDYIELVDNLGHKSAYEVKGQMGAAYSNSALLANNTDVLNGTLPALPSNLELAPRQVEEAVELVFVPVPQEGRQAIGSCQASLVDSIGGAVEAVEVDYAWVSSRAVGRHRSALIAVADLGKDAVDHDVLVMGMFVLGGGCSEDEVFETSRLVCYKPYISRFVPNSSFHLQGGMKECNC